MLKPNNFLQPTTFPGLGENPPQLTKMEMPKYELKLAFIVKQLAWHPQIIILIE
jgi:hypothetical protein